MELAIPDVRVLKHSNDRKTKSYEYVASKEKNYHILYEHQDLLRRVMRYEKACMLIHLVGRGKSLAIICAIEHFRGQNNLKVYIITKEVIKSEMIKDLALYHGKAVSKELQMYKFYTYFAFKIQYENFSDEKIHEAFDNSIFVIDEIHNLVSDASNDDGTNGTDMKKFNVIMKIRNTAKNMKCIAASASPMINSSTEIQASSRFLRGDKALKEEWNRLYNTDYESQIIVNDSEDNDEIQISTFFANQITVPIFYKGQLEVSCHNYIGTEFTISEITNKPNKALPNEKKYIREILTMSKHQTKNYMKTFSTSGVYRASRGESICSSTIMKSIDAWRKLPKNKILEKVKKYSALFHYWLDIELKSLANNEFGATAIYFDDIKTGGAETYANLLDLLGWEQYDKDTASLNNKPKYVLFSSANGSEINTRNAINSPENVDGSVVRTILFTRAFRDGVSFINVLRIAGVEVWTGTSYIQYIGRGTRGNSYIHYGQLLENKKFIDLHTKEGYLKKDETKGYVFTPKILNAISVPDTKHLDTLDPSKYSAEGEAEVPYTENPRFSKIREHYSIDLRMLDIRNSKDSSIDQIFNSLIKRSIDIGINNNIDDDKAFEADNYFAVYQNAEISWSLSNRQRIEEQTSGCEPKERSTVPFVSGYHLATTSETVARDTALYQISNCLYASSVMHAYGPLGGDDFTRYSNMYIDTAPKPIPLEIVNSKISNLVNDNIRYTAPEDTNPLNYLVYQKSITNISVITQALSRLGKYLYKVLPCGSNEELSNYAPNINLQEMVKEIGELQIVLLAMYIKHWTLGYSIDEIKCASCERSATFKFTCSHCYLPLHVQCALNKEYCSEDCRKQSKKRKKYTKRTRPLCTGKLYIASKLTKLYEDVPAGVNAYISAWSLINGFIYSNTILAQKMDVIFNTDNDVLCSEYYTNTWKAESLSYILVAYNGSVKHAKKRSDTSKATISGQAIPGITVKNIIEFGEHAEDSHPKKIEHIKDTTLKNVLIKYTRSNDDLDDEVVDAFLNNRIIMHTLYPIEKDGSYVEWALDTIWKRFQQPNIMKNSKIIKSRQRKQVD
jgi:hypothetical protein